MKHISLLLLSLLLAIASCRPQAETPDSQLADLSKDMAIAHEALKNSDPVKGSAITSEILLHLPASAHNG